MIGVCRFCGCTEDRPCAIPRELNGGLAIGAGGLYNGRLDYIACAWLLPDVCDAPPCVEKAYADARLNAEELTMRLEEGLRFEFDPRDAA